MDWKELGKKAAEIGLPLLGAVLPVPGGAAIGAALGRAIGASGSNGTAGATADQIFATLTQSAEALQKAREFEAQHQERLIAMSYENSQKMRAADSSDIATVNQTMQEEVKNAQNEDRVQRWWRPANGYAVAAGSFAGVIGSVGLFAYGIVTNNPQAISQIPVLASALATILAVPGAAVGITAWQRSREKITRMQLDQQPNEEKK
jgi:roadblock/LC7 domain-containing protein